MLAGGSADWREEGTVYSGQRSFRIPLDLSADERAGITGIRLYVSENGGRTWVRHHDADPSAQFITFRANEDGPYWFSVALVDRQGEQIPADIRTAEPGLRVMVDTARPELSVKAIRSRTGKRGIRWVMTDPNLLSETHRLAGWNAAIGQWEPLESMHPEDHLLWFDEGVQYDKIQSCVSDRAGNERVVEVEIVGDQFSKRDVAAFVLAKEVASDVIPTSAEAPIDEPSLVQPAVVAPTAHPPAVPATICSSHQVVVNYVVEQAADGSAIPAELWVTRDDGRTWQRVAVDLDGKSPLEAKLEGDDVWGLRILLHAGQGQSSGPPPGTAPEMLVDVDTTAPEVRVVSAEAAGGQVVVRWQAVDKNLDAQPIDILYAADPASEWRPAATGLANTGEFTFPVADWDAQVPMYLRVEARDRARHVGFSQTDRPLRMR
jgi:hypothetical protein